jgi:hypothetical protein
MSEQCILDAFPADAGGIVRLLLPRNVLEACLAMAWLGIVAAE